MWYSQYHLGLLDLFPFDFQVLPESMFSTKEGIFATEPTDVMLFAIASLENPRFFKEGSLGSSLATCVIITPTLRETNG